MFRFAYVNWRYDWSYRYAKRFQAKLFGKPFDRLAETRLGRIFYGGFSSGFLLLLGGALLILGISLLFGL
ncbi:MAG TPA: hypothetical protein VGR77_08480 [Candidatus Dormibacteraeota bacterium]|nr:hypothetical protein [Candidatus Dormibacteraeota bacterium]